MFFVLLTMASWGSYVPMIHAGQKAMGMAGLKAFLFIGLAYAVCAIFVPGFAIWSGMEADKTITAKGGAISTVAGVLGAVGALGIIFAIKSGGSPLYVAPLVFCGAPIVSVFVSILMHPPKGGFASINPMMFLGVLLAASGAGMVLYYKPAA
jgi:hypothetical protein